MFLQPACSRVKKSRAHVPKMPGAREREKKERALISEKEDGEEEGERGGRRGTEKGDLEGGMRRRKDKDEIERGRRRG